MTGGNDRSTARQDQDVAGAGQNPRTVTSGNFAEGSNSKWVKAKPLACSPLQAYAQAVLKAVIKAAEAAARTASLNTAHKATTSTRTEAGDADGSADARGATILLGPDRVFLFKARQEEGHEENTGSPCYTR